MKYTGGYPDEYNEIILDFSIEKSERISLYLTSRGKERCTGVSPWDFMPEMIADNLKSVTERIARCCEKIGRPSGSVRLLPVTKEASITEMRKVIDAGLSRFGENRVQDALLKYKVFGDSVEWHLVGHLQTNKVKDAVSIFSLIHSIDSLKLARMIDKEAARIGKRQSVIVQVNISGEKSKFGISTEGTIEFLKKALAYPNLSIEGLMTIAPEATDPESARPYFRALKELFAETKAALSASDRKAMEKYSILSMGMTNDFEVAIEEGSSLVRIGRAIFNSPSSASRRGRGLQ